MDKNKKIIEEPAIVLFHLNNDYTKILLERTKGIGMANGGIDWDIPTKIIPIHLRKIGSRFLIRKIDDEFEVIEIVK
jgi:hypothetical protein